MIAWLLALLGLVILLLAGDSLVRGAVNLSLRLGVPALIVSLTIVAFGTSAPELLISIKAVLEHAPGIALGNVVGSNTANILMVLGIPAIMAAMHTSQCDSRKTYIFMLLSTLLFISLAYMGVFTLPAGIILLVALALVLWDQMREALRHRREGCEAADEEMLEGLEEADPNMPYWRIGIYLALGLIGLPLGANLLVENASVIARTYGVSDTVIGLTLVAVGTSLPELATTVMAALRKQADVALGNVIGSNMFNLLAIIGVATLFGPIPVDPEFLRFDLWVMLGATLLLIPFVFLRFDITRGWGIVLTLLYAGYVVSVLA
ncbi:calcium/sodium antiporter [Pseudodonghicola flavimaris]|uniref:Calcium/sodium antiporter n=1 Tax=Pseudodonghicola flavimaris TaxID=3050036 RepID=A0ABT7EYB6_9RHOB|nr:calcium/sodium antiporter [Pseudodonghicola flavimaris]MDK3017264.1 calcium/sodium antiporter [Pseudodonghicola flavimaris]